MPVFTRTRDGVLEMTVDGDFTANEVRRVAFKAFEAEDAPSAMKILLDVSGAAGIASKSSDEMQAAGAIFGAYRDRIAGLGVVAAADVHSMFAAEGDFGREAGISIHACHSHAEAREALGVSVS